MLYTLSPPHAGHRKDFVVQEGGRVVRTGVTNQTFFILVFFSCFRVKQTKKNRAYGEKGENSFSLQSCLAGENA